ncbi:MAG: hypothetical protein KTR13_10700 [Saprospiraceae bacterium]|nr:hypothetical protein [Saprospiraceae bacterium]
MSQPTQTKEVRRLAAVMFTDIKGYTSMVQNDEETALKKVEHHRNILTSATERNNGQVIQFYGDGSLSIYNSALEAVQCAVEMQKAYLELDVPVRVGIHLGDIVIKNDTIYGDGVNVSSRIESQGIPGAIVVSKKMQQELQNHPAFPVKSVGYFALKNVSQKEEIFIIDHPDIYVPLPKEFKTKERINRSRLIFRVLPILLVGIAAFLIGGKVFMNKNNSSKNNVNEVVNQRIAVQVFDNLTNTDSLAILSNMTAHWVTKALSETENAQVVSYQTVTQNLSESFNGNDLSEELGATNMINGSIFLKGDSLIFSSFIQNLKTGVITHTFSDVSTSASTPLDGITALANSVKGYWSSKDENLLSPPTYDAYKAYIKAKDNWEENDVLAKQELKKAIQLDPSFLDPYFLLLDLYFYEGDLDASRALINELKRKETSMTARQQNILNYHEADIQAKNKLAYEFYLKEFENDPKDLFVNNTMMILAIEYVNAPEKAIEYFNKIQPESLDLYNCQYCLDRVYSGVIAHALSANAPNADQLVSKLEQAANTRQQLLGVLKYYVKKADTTSIDRVLEELMNGAYRNPAFAYYVTAREFALKGDQKQKNHYGNKALSMYQDNPSRTLARIQYLLEDYPSALKTLEVYLEEDTENLWDLTLNTLTQIRLGNTEAALPILAQLEAESSGDDFGQNAYYQAQIYTALDRQNEAISKLEEALSAGLLFNPFGYFENDPELLPLKDNAAYQKLLNPLNE